MTHSISTGFIAELALPTAVMQAGVCAPRVDDSLQSTHAGVPVGGADTGNKPSTRYVVQKLFRNPLRETISKKRNELISSPFSNNHFVCTSLEGLNPTLVLKHFGTQESFLHLFGLENNTAINVNLPKLPHKGRGIPPCWPRDVLNPSHIGEVVSGIVHHEVPKCLPFW